jgi:hypothetical protein
VDQHPGRLRQSEAQHDELSGEFFGRFAAAPLPPGRMSVGPWMSIDKNSNGFPEVNLEKKTTQVNVWMVVAVVCFLLGGTALAYWASHRNAGTEISASLQAPPGR